MKELFGNLSHLMTQRKQLDEAAFVDLAGKILAAVPDVGWELGPDLLDPALDRLSLSIRHEPGFLEQAAAALPLPLTGDGWIIDVGIPPRDWDMYFDVELDGQELGVEGNRWYFRMSDSGRKIDLELGVPARELAHADADALDEFAEILLSGELGEKNTLRFVRAVEVARRDHFGDGWKPLTELREEFCAKFPSCEYAQWLRAARQGK